MAGIKRIAAALVCAVICLCMFFGGADCWAGEAEKAPGVTVADDANVLMEEEADWLKGIAQALSEKSGWSVVAATCSDAGGKKAQTLCEEYFNKYTTGDDGISCLVDLDNGELYLATAGEAQLYLTDSRLDNILEKAHAAAQKEDYTQALYLMMYESDQAYTRGMPEDVKVTDEGANKPGTIGSIAFMAVAAVGGFILGKIVRGRTKGKRAGYYRRPYRRPPNAASRRTSRPANRSTVHRGAGGRKFGGRGRKF